MKLAVLSILAALAAAGCVSSGGGEPEAAAAQLDTPSVAPVVQDVALEGQLGPSVCVNLCAGSALGEKRFFATDAVGRLDVALTFEWDAASPRTETLFAGVFSCDPDACRSDADLTLVEFVDGPSPLVFELADIEVPDGETLYIFANAPALFGGVVYAQAVAPQAFTVTGTLTERA